MKYNDLIQVNENFQYSVNLQFDINNISKIKEYIPTKDGCEVLKFYINSIINTKNRATTLIGPYGKGKSHLLLVLLTLINNYNNNNDEKHINNFINKVKNVDIELSEMLLELRNNKLKLMPIIINSNYDDLNQAFLLALSEALERENLSDIVVNTYFDVALKVISKWETQYKDAITNVKTCLEEYNCTLKELKNGLKSYNHKYYEIFKNVYSCILHGQEFSPLINSDIIKTYKDVTFEIKEYGYSGVYIVFDEFSKFLECVDNERMMKDLKLLQDFAELSTRTGKTEQIHLNCITHKTINEYIKNFKEDKVNAFKTVEGRFKEVYFNRSLDQNYEIVSYALEKTKVFDQFYENYYKNNIEFYNNLSTLNVFLETQNIEKNLFKGCFPLNPLTVYSLIELSEKIAQNERTLFTFLTDDDQNSLKKFILNESNGLFTVDKIYDYFKPLFKKEVDEYIKSIWIKVENSILKATNNDEKAILKVLGIIYMLNDLEIFSPEDEVIRLSLNLDIDRYEICINNLIDKSIVKRRKITNDLDFATIYNREVTKEIKNLCETKFSEIDEKDVINKIYDSGYSLPRRYNEEYKMTRYFKNIFMSETELENISNFSLLFNQYICDGIVINLIRTSRNIQNIKDKFERINDKKVVLRISRNIFSKVFSNLLKEYEAIDYLKNNIGNSSEMLNELNIMQFEIREAIIDGLNEYLSKENIQEYLYLGKEYKKITNISSFISDICETVYDKTPIINNELINKNELSSPIKKARAIVIDTILSNDINLISSQTSAEATIYKAIVGKKHTQSVKEILNVIDDFISKSENNKISFEVLYKKLTKEPYSVRKGIIPILLSLSLYNLADNIIIYFMNKEIDLDSTNLVKINDNPEKYYILIEKGTTEKIKYISSMMEVFDIPNVDNTRVNLKKLIDSMKRWVLSLPRILRELNDGLLFDAVKKEYLQVKSELLKPDINNNEFIYKDLLEIFDTSDYQLVVTEFKNMKEIFDNFVKMYSEKLIIEVKDILIKNFKGSLTSLLKEWYNKMDLSKSNVIYDFKTKEVVNYINELVTHDEFDVIEKLSKIVTGYYIEDWQSTEYEKFIEFISNLSSNIKNTYISSESNIKLMLINGDETIERNLISDNEISALGQTMKSNIEELIGEYGDSLNEQEKVNILLDIMKKYL